MNKEASLDSLNGTIKDQYVSNISTIVTLISFTMLFATLFLGYALYRLTAESWPPMGIEPPSLGLPMISTLVIFLSSVAYWMFEKNFEINKENKGWLWITALLGFAFLGTQVTLWSSLKASGLYSSSGIFGSIIFGFTWIHAAHILMGIGALGWLAFKLKMDDMKLMTVQNVGKFWHFLGIIWLIMFITIFAI
ncbi:MAG: cytochrome c oxidase subunit 3 [Bacteriovoracaceae bacterium]|jgi:cytochrome c oxidase subunit 3